MLYGFRDGSTVYVTAGDNQSQYDIFVEGVGTLELEGETPNVFDLMSNPLTSGMDGVFRIEFKNDDEAIEKAALCGIVLEARSRAIEKRLKMQIVEEDAAEARDREDNGLANTDHRTIEEIFGLDHNDPWDKRTPEQIEKANEMKEKMKDAAKNGQVSGESFSPRKRKDDLARVWETKGHENADGTITIDSVLAVKGQITRRQPREFVFAVTDDTVPVDETGFLYTVVALDWKEVFDSTGTFFPKDLDAKMNGIIPKALAGIDFFDLDTDLDDDDDSPPPHLYTFKGATPEAVRATLLAMGFVEDQVFTDRVAKVTPFDFVKVSDPAELSLALPNQEVRSWQTDISSEDAPTYFFEAKEDISALLETMLEATGADPNLISVGGPDKFVTMDGQFAKEFGHVLDTKQIEYEVSPQVPEDDRALTAPSQVAIIFRLDTSLPLLDAYETLKAEGVNIGSWTIRRGVRLDDHGSYFICGIERFAKQILKKLEEHHSMIISEIYGINVSGDRIVPKGSGVTVVDQNEEEEIGPRPWNAEAHLIEHLTDEEREENEKAINAKEFIFSGSWNHETRTTTIYITPETYFKEWKEFWNEPLPIRHLIPDHLKEVEPGVFESKSQNYNDLTFHLCQRGFQESMALRLWLNNQ